MNEHLKSFHTSSVKLTTLESVIILKMVNDIYFYQSVNRVSTERYLLRTRSRNRAVIRKIIAISCILKELRTP